MIHDAKVEVTCDGRACTESVEIEPEYVYRTMSGSSGHYDCSESAIEDKLPEKGWTVADGKHLCESCSAVVKEGKP